MINTLILLLLLGNIKPSNEMHYAARIGERMGTYCFGCGTQQWGEQRLPTFIDELTERIILSSARAADRYPPFYEEETWKRPKGRTAFIDPDGREWTEDPSRHGGYHWDVKWPNGERIMEVDADGNIITNKHLGGTDPKKK